MLNVKITSSGYYTPPKIETAKQVASKIGKTEDWIISRTGVHKRRISDIDVDQMAAVACKDAIGSSSIPDLIINVEGNYDAVMQANANHLGTVWNSWETTWSGTVVRDDGRPSQAELRRRQLEMEATMSH